MGSSPNTVVLILAEEHLEGKRAGFQSALHSEWGIDYNILFLVIHSRIHTKFSEHAHHVADSPLERRHLALGPGWRSSDCLLLTWEVCKTCHAERHGFCGCLAFRGVKSSSDGCSLI